MSNQPFWFGKNRSILELPMTRGFAGSVGRVFSSGLATIFDHQMLARWHIPAFLSRFGLAERITLTPEGIDTAANKRLTKQLIAQGHRVFQLSYHSSSLVAGNTPYVRTERELDQFLDRIDQYLDFFLNSLGGISLTHAQLYVALARDRRNNLDVAKHLLFDAGSRQKAPTA
jgi:hypothetical protein